MLSYQWICIILPMDHYNYPTNESTSSHKRIFINIILPLDHQRYPTNELTLSFQWIINIIQPMNIH